MFNEYSSEEARLLRQLLTDAHTQIRELQAQVEQLSSALLMLTLGDRRRASGFHPDGSRERRRESASTVAPERDRRGRGRQPSA
jgi:hypothetical protein